MSRRDRWTQVKLAIFVVVSFAALWMLLRQVFPDAVASSPRPIQDQGSSPYCLFAAAGYLTQIDMWELSHAYSVEGHPRLGLTPTNRGIFDLLRARYGIALKVAKQWDSDAVRAQVQHRPVAVSGHGHAYVLLAWDARGTIVYVDSLRAGEVLTMRDVTFWDWWDGWAWWRP